VLFSVGAQFVVFLRWIHRRSANEIQRVLIRDLALKHLPSIYRALHSMAEQQGISLDETQPVNYVDMCAMASTAEEDHGTGIQLESLGDPL
jgi:hypothetical protein